MSEYDGNCTLGPAEGNANSNQRKPCDYSNFKPEGDTYFSGRRSKLRDRPDFSERFRSFSPSARHSGEEILQDLKDKLKRDRDLFFKSSPEWRSFGPKFRTAEESDDWPKKDMDDLRSRHPMFRMPAWMSEDEDMSDLASRMSHAPSWATMSRRPPPQSFWRERKNSGGSAMSTTSDDDSSDVPHAERASQSSGTSTGSEPVCHDIPIRLVAEAPENYCQKPQYSETQQPKRPQRQPSATKPEAVPQPARVSFVRKPPQYATRTASAVETGGSSEQVPRDSRCASAPPDVTDGVYQPQRFVSKININPQSPGSPKPKLPFSPTINSIPKPFVPLHKQQEMQHPVLEEESTQECQSDDRNPPSFSQQTNYYQQPNSQQQPQESPPHQQPQQQRMSGQRPSIVRNIPIFIEGRDEPLANKEDPARQTQQQQQPHHQFHTQGDQYGPQGQQFPGGFPNRIQGNQQQPQDQPQFNRQKFESSKPSEPSKPPEPPKSHILTEPLEKIAAVRNSICEYQARAENFVGVKTDREYLFLDEMLTRALLNLDNIDPDGRDDVRQARRALIKDINNTLSTLEKKASSAGEKFQDVNPVEDEDAMSVNLANNTEEGCKHDYAGQETTNDTEEERTDNCTNRDSSHKMEDTNVMKTSSNCADNQISEIESQKEVTEKETKQKENSENLAVTEGNLTLVDDPGTGEQARSSQDTVQEPMETECSAEVKTADAQNVLQSTEVVKTKNPSSTEQKSDDLTVNTDNAESEQVV